ncbi:TetR/AcrR family transcriptional regulator [Paractinoplanes toevensis]|uniref:TetR family transcriptional regulator n=1 Tax=Paractinoplanes toevensis TaxID=571911 RepID=A0A919TA43_9ACTN|nr:TetR/AcrR family transcriptional regulator [Actinoplanes toevensis]GIM91287.1 TetR family transcriptional regulator [Actinoplanes toevensis]
MEAPYESTGRTGQKSRTRLALVAAARRLLDDGLTPKVEDAAAQAGISRSTAYRYFPNQRSLLLAAHPSISPETLLPANASTDPGARLDAVIQEFTGYNFTWEPQLRTSLRLSLEPAAERTALRQGRAIGWIAEALTPLRDTHPGIDIHQLAIAIRSATGIETLIWLTDVAGYTREQAAGTVLANAHALLDAAVRGSRPRSGRRNP